jgi:hypothetical protein
VLEGFRPLMHDSKVDASPFVKTLGWTTVEQQKHGMLALLNFTVINLNSFDARARRVLRCVATALGFPIESLCKLESQYARTLASLLEAKDHAGKRGRGLGTWFKIGVVAVLGGTVVAATAGAAAPAVAGGLAAVGLGGAATAVGSGAGVALVSSLFG